MPYSASHKLETRQRILESARRLFNAKGFVDVSIDEVMDHAGLTHGGFYRHFRDKGELYAEAVRWFLCEEAPKPWQRPRGNAGKSRATASSTPTSRSTISTTARVAAPWSACPRTSRAPTGR